METLELIEITEILIFIGLVVTAALGVASYVRDKIEQKERELRGATKINESLYIQHYGLSHSAKGPQK